MHGPADELPIIAADILARLRTQTPRVHCITNSVAQTLTEMGRGERFVVNFLRARARERERWFVGLPLAALGLLGLSALVLLPRRPR